MSENVVLHEIDCQNTSMNKSRCHLCESFIEDWLSMPLQPNEYFYTKLKWKKIGPFTKILAKYLCKIIHDLLPLERYILERNIDTYRKKIHSYFIPSSLSKEDIPVQMLQTCEWMSVIEGFMNTRFVEEIEIITDILHNNSILSKPVLIHEWIGCWITRVNTVIPEMHLEHTKVKSCSYTGPPVTE